MKIKELIEALKYQDQELELTFGHRNDVRPIVQARITKPPMKWVENYNLPQGGTWEPNKDQEVMILIEAASSTFSWNPD
jgi:hypothetical protein